MEKLTQREWLDFVNRLQERERQKISSSGISNWALFVAIGGLGYWLFPEIPIIILNINKLMLYSAIFLNISIAIFNVFNREFRTHKIINYRRIEVPPLERLCRKILKFFELNIGIIISVVTFLAVFMNQELRLDIKIILFLLALRMLLGFISMFSKIQGINFQRLESSLKGNDFSLFVRFYRSFELYLCLYPLVMMIILFRFSKTDLRIALFGLIFMLIVILLQLLLVIFTKRLKIAWLEDFEREIITMELNDYEIRKKIKETYFRLSHIDDYF